MNKYGIFDPLLSPMPQQSEESMSNQPCVNAGKEVFPQSEGCGLVNDITRESGKTITDETRSIMELEINPTFRDLLPPLAPEEQAILEGNLLKEGSREPITVWNPDGATNPIIIDGHHRYEICVRHKITFTTVEMEFDNEEQVCAWIDRNQIGRRNLHGDAFKLAIGRIYNREKRDPIANLFQNSRLCQRDTLGLITEEGGGANAPGPYSVGDDDLPKGQNVPSGSTAERLAREFNVSEKTIKRAGKVAEEIEARPDWKAEIYKGTSLQKLKARDRQMPEGDLQKNNRDNTEQVADSYIQQEVIAAIKKLAGKLHPGTRLTIDVRTDGVDLNLSQSQEPSEEPPEETSKEHLSEMHAEKPQNLPNTPKSVVEDRPLASAEEMRVKKVMTGKEILEQKGLQTYFGGRLIPPNKIIVSLTPEEARVLIDYFTKNSSLSLKSNTVRIVLTSAENQSVLSPKKTLRLLKCFQTGCRVDLV